MNIVTHHTAKSIGNSRYWRAILEGTDPDRRAYVTIESWNGTYAFSVMDGGQALVTGNETTLRAAIQRAAHYAWHMTCPNERNPY